jgi:hypothetical protein
MKKISTAAAPKIEKVEGQKLTIGLDLGDRSIELVLILEDPAVSFLCPSQLDAV